MAAASVRRWLDTIEPDAGSPFWTNTLASFEHKGLLRKSDAGWIAATRAPFQEASDWLDQNIHNPCRIARLRDMVVVEFAEPRDAVLFAFNGSEEPLLRGVDPAIGHGIPWRRGGPSPLSDSKADQRLSRLLSQIGTVAALGRGKAPQ